MCPTKNRLSLRASVSFGFFMSGEAGKRGSGEARQGGGEARRRGKEKGTMITCISNLGNF